MFGGRRRSEDVAPRRDLNDYESSPRDEKSKRSTRQRTPSPIRRLIDHWWDRLMGAVSDGSFSGQDEEYDAHRTTRDYMWNTIGYALWGLTFPLLTIVVTQLSGVERAGMFSLAFVTANLLFILGNYGVRTYQVSDINQTHSFSDYQFHRILTCIIMVVAGYLYCSVRGYGEEMFMMSIGLYLFKAIDALADVYEGRLQQHDKLYLGGISQSVRSFTGLIVFIILLVITGSLVAASIGMAISALVSLVVVTLPLAYFETPKSKPFSMRSVGQLFRACAPLFIALFMYALIDNMPKFVMEGVLSYDNQLYFNVMYFPAQAILISVGLIYRPLLVRMANAWADVSRRKRFDLLIVVMVLIIVAMTVIGILLMGWIGIPILTFLYGVDFEQFRSMVYIMLVAGGVTAAIDFLYQVVTILRRQKIVTELYLITFGLSVLILLLMINMTGLEGAVVGYLVVMIVLLILLLREYIIVRIRLMRHPEAEDGGDGSTKMSGTGLFSGVEGFAKSVDFGKVGKGLRRNSSQRDSDFNAPGDQLEHENEGAASSDGSLQQPPAQSERDPRKGALVSDDCERTQFSDLADAHEREQRRMRNEQKAQEQAHRKAVLDEMEADRRKQARARLKMRQEKKD